MNNRKKMIDLNIWWTFFNDKLFFNEINFKLMNN